MGAQMTRTVVTALVSAAALTATSFAARYAMVPKWMTISDCGGGRTFIETWARYADFTIPVFVLSAIAGLGGGFLMSYLTPTDTDLKGARGLVAGVSLVASLLVLLVLGGLSVLISTGSTL